MHKNNNCFRTTIRRLICGFCLLLSAIALGTSCSVRGTERLAKGQPVTDSIVNDDLHYYTVGLEKGQYLALTIDQHDVDVIAKVFAPNGDLIGEFDTPTSGRGTETVRIGAETAGEYRVEIYTLSARAEPGDYTIKMVDFHPMTERDRRILSAVNLHLEADRLRANADTRPACLPVYEKAL